MSTAQVRSQSTRGGIQGRPKNSYKIVRDSHTVFHRGVGYRKEVVSQRASRPVPTDGLMEPSPEARATNDNVSGAGRPTRDAQGVLAPASIREVEIAEEPAVWICLLYLYTDVNCIKLDVCALAIARTNALVCLRIQHG